MQCIFEHILIVMEPDDAQRHGQKKPVIQRNCLNQARQDSQCKTRKLEIYPTKNEVVEDIYLEPKVWGRTDPWEAPVHENHQDYNFIQLDILKEEDESQKIWTIENIH